jgi:hypothetical protein
VPLRVDFIPQLDTKKHQKNSKKTAKTPIFKTNNPTNDHKKPLKPRSFKGQRRKRAMRFEALACSLQTNALQHHHPH